MLVTRVRVQGFRAFSDTEHLALTPLTGIVGRNDTGKSGILHGISAFFKPPKKGLVDTDFHKKNTGNPVVIELSFFPLGLRSRAVRIDAKNTVDIIGDYLVDDDELLTARLTIYDKKVGPFELRIRDVDDPNLFPLADKNETQLLDLLAARGLPAVKSGKETNQEKRNALRKAATGGGAGWKCDWVDASAMEKSIRDILPTFLFFTDQARYGIGETPVQNQFKAIVDQAVAATSDAAKIESQMKAAIQGEFDKVFEHLQHLTDAVSGMQADPKINWKKAVDGIELLWSDSHGVEIPFELRGAGVRRLFMVAYFQYLAAEGLYDPNGPQYLFAIEEPELHLHPGAQRVLCDALLQFGEIGHQVVFTTHSPVFASLSPGDGLILVQRSGSSADASQIPNIDLAEVAKELGVEASDRLVGKNHIVLVEGKNDVEFYEAVLEELHGNAETSLEPSKVLFLQCGGVHNLQWVVTTQRLDEAALNWAVIVDSDRSAAGDPLEGAAADLSTNAPASCDYVAVLERSFIENYFDSAAVKAVTGLDAVVNDFGKPQLRSGKKLKETDLSKIKNAAGEIAKEMGPTRLKNRSLKPDGTSELVEIFDKIHTAFGF